MNRVEIHSEYITLGQFLKFVGYISNGGEAKNAILNAQILVNNQFETRRGRKIYPGDKVFIGKSCYLIEKKH